MQKQKKAPPLGDGYDYSAIEKIALKVKAEGFVPLADLRTEFGADEVTKAIAILYRDYRMFREVRRQWKDGRDALGYEWDDRCRRGH